ncbi:hypothetical protein J1TS5_25830 [Paenibacillus macerans]|uniref:hypothetical protein n=1 Tax=Paenibacillus macerans TaxID=44252 RepID=UPI001B15BFF3|nr:hypothetical protein [Paenibacillus macerans]GIP10413.1 hypothetical protein J1TS5_25830 [Paenibacillus macerans]
MPKHIWTLGEDKRLDELKGTGTYAEIAAKLSREFNVGITSEAVRKRIKREKKTEQAPSGYKETVEILADGSHKSDKLLRMSAEQSKDVNYLLEAHGYDLNAWELVSARNNIWNVYSKQDGVQTLYSSKITVKPRQYGTNIDGLIKAIEKMDQVRVHIDPFKKCDGGLLEIPIFDSHFGISDYDYYKPTQQKIFERLSSRNWERVLFILGQDMLHNDGFRGTTSSGTPIEAIDTVTAWEDARKFFEPLIELAITQSSAVDVVYSCGNHDEALGWAFVQMIKARYPQTNVDDRLLQRKAVVYGDNFIGITHGDKGRKDLHNIFPIEFPVEWSGAKNREIHTGHLHVEETKDVFGMAVRTLATRNRTDKWHRENGFVGAHKRFMLFEYSEKELESIHYV